MFALFSVKGRADRWMLEKTWKSLTLSCFKILNSNVLFFLVSQRAKYFFLSIKCTLRALYARCAGRTGAGRQWNCDPCRDRARLPTASFETRADFGLPVISDSIWWLTKNYLPSENLEVVDGRTLLLKRNWSYFGPYNFSGGNVFLLGKIYVFFSNIITY